MSTVPAPSPPPPPPHGTSSGRELIDPSLDAQLPAYLKEAAGSSTTSSSMITGHATVPAISIQGKQFCFPDEQPLAQGSVLDVVILESDPPEGVAKSFYEKTFQPGTKEAPDCASSNGKFPDPFIAEPVCDNCTSCPHNQFGSGINADGSPSKGKRCSDFKNLYVVREYDLQGTVFVIRIPATSLKALSSYGRYFEDRNVLPQGIVTRLSFDNATHPQLIFQPVRWLEEADGRLCIERSKSRELRSLLPSGNSASGPKAIAVQQTSAGLDRLPPPEPVHVMTASANGVAYEEFLKTGWTDKTLIEAGHMRAPVPSVVVAVPTVPAAPSPPPPPVIVEEPKMTVNAGGISYADYIAKGWSEDQLIANGLMEARK